MATNLGEDGDTDNAASPETAALAIASLPSKRSMASRVVFAA